MKNSSPLVLSLLCTISLAGCPAFGPGDVQECPVCGHIWCQENVVVTCECHSASPDGGTNMIIMAITDCSPLNLTCMALSEGTGTSWGDSNWSSGDAQCLDLCDTPGEAQCLSRDGEESWHVCGPREGVDRTNLQSMVMDWVLSPETPGQTVGDINIWYDSLLPCLACSSSCGCDVGFQCLEGYCLPGGDDGLVCCGRERETACPQGQPCEQLDGSQGLCATVGRCEPCETYRDCETDDCLSTGSSLPPVCLPWAEADEGSLACREDLNQVWRMDVCGLWVEVIQPCAEGYRCQVDECLLNLPDIEVYPTLLSFEDTPLLSTSTLNLSVGNIGDAELNVYEIAVDPAYAQLFSVSPSSVLVAVNDIVELTVSFTPEEEGDVHGRLAIRSDDEDEPEIIILMNGAGVP